MTTHETDMSKAMVYKTPERVDRPLPMRPDRRPDGPHDPVRHAAYLRVSALRNAVEHYDGRTGVSADDVVEAAELFHDFLTRKDTP